MDQAKDKNGKTESEFLQSYDVNRYFRPSVTVDALLYVKTDDGIKVLLVKRGGHPYIGKLAFPGGFVERDESCETAVARELYEETGIAGVSLRQLVTVSTPGRDPRWRTVSVAFCGRMDEAVPPTAGDDAADAAWYTVRRTSDDTVSVDDGKDVFFCRLDIVRDAFGKLDLNATRVLDGGRFAFDHAKLVWYLSEAIEKD